MTKVASVATVNTIGSQVKYSSWGDKSATSALPTMAINHTGTTLDTFIVT
jgi:hypothetical protein